MRRVCFILLAGLAACAPAEPDPRGVRRNEVLLQVSATGRTDARPDEGRFTVGVSSDAATSAAASTANNTTMQRVVAGLQRLGIKPDDIQTRSVTLSRIDYGRELGRYRAGNMVEVRVRDLKLISPAIAAATEAGGNVVSGPDLRLSSPEAADTRAYAAAYRAARARADAYAAAAGLRVARVLAIRDETALGGRIGYGAATSNEMAVPVSAPPPPIQAGVSTREVRVRADFALAK